MSPTLIRLLLLSLGCALSRLSAEFPLRDLAVDRALPLTDWRFQAEPADAEVDWSTDDFAEERAAWPEVRIPAVWDKAPGKVRLPVPARAGWFRIEVPVPELEQDQELALCFLGVKFIADVFVNGEYLGVHRGGYTPFVFALPEVPPGRKTLEVVLRVDSRMSDNTVPKHRIGWELYGGIDREAYLLVRPQNRPERVFAQTFRSEAGIWQLRLRADTVGSPDAPLEIELSENGKTALRHRIENWREGVDVTLPLKNPTLWSPEQPHLYQLNLRWGKQELRFPVGVREIKWEAGKLRLNGKALWLQGFGQHEFTPLSGSILTTEQRRQDLRMMKDLYRANALRTGHYPHHPELFALADEIGLLLFTEIPVWQNPANTLTRPEVWDSWIAPQLDEMVLTLRNHPSVFGWGVLNETYGAGTYITRARDRIRNLDPGRGVAAVVASHHDFGVNALTDFAARNLHYGWYHSRSVYTLREGLRRNLENADGNAVWVAELGGLAKPGSLGGGYSDDVRGTETYQDKMTRFGLQYIMSRAEDMAGISLWTWSDYERGGGPHYHGILSAAREPKLAAYTAMNLMRPPLTALGTENQAVVPAGEDFTAELSIFAREPLPGKKLSLIWQIRRADSVLLEGKQEAVLEKGHVTSAGEARWSVDADHEPGLHYLYLELRGADGAFVHSQAVPFEAVRTTRPGILRVPPHADGEEHAAELNGMRFTVYPHTGLLLPLAEGEYEIGIDGARRRFSIRAGEPTDLPWEK